MEVTISIVNWNTREFLQRCLQSIFDNKPEIDFEIIVVDNASKDDSIGMLEENFPQIKVIKNSQNVGFAKANNQAIKQSTGKYILLLNPDTQFIMKKTLERMISWMKVLPNAGILAPQLLNPDGSIQKSVRRFPNPWGIFCYYSGLARLFKTNRFFNNYLMEYWNHNEFAQVEQPMGACLLVKRKVFEEVGLLSEEFFMYYEDVEFCWRVREQGWKIFFIPEVKILHYGGQSASLVKGSNFYERSKNLVKFMRIYYRNSRPRIFLVKLSLGLGTLLRLLYYGVACLLSQSFKQKYSPMLDEGGRLLLDLVRL